MVDRSRHYAKKSDIRPGGAEQTRVGLIRAALGQFGRLGYDGASTRDIAAAAGANIGSIAYHFGGKEGLHTACAEHIVETMRAVAAPALGSLSPDQALTRQAAEDAIAQAIERMAGFVVGQPQAGDFVSFILRELGQPTRALDIVYEGIFEPVHKRLCAVWAAATGEDAESDRTRLQVFTLIGQVVYFRIARAAVMRRMGWQDIAGAETDAILDVARGNVEAILAARRKAPEEPL